MKLALGCLALATLLTACGSESEAGPLAGSWGGPSMSVSATSGTVLVTLTCGANIKVSHPILLDAAGRFTIVDSLRGRLGGGGATDTLPSVLPHSPVQAVELDGQISGDVLTVSFTLELSTGDLTLPFTFTATKGQPGNTYEICRT